MAPTDTYTHPHFAHWVKEIGRGIPDVPIQIAVAAVKPYRIFRDEPVQM
jgi:hypothetical protein